MTDAHEAKQATPHATLLAELLDSRIPKSEREHAAKREIERLRAERDSIAIENSKFMDQIERLRAALRHEADCVEATKEQK